MRKADGTRQIFDRKKIVSTCLRMGATEDVAEEVAKRVESRVYDGVGTGEILRMIFRFLGRYKPEARYHMDLRRSLGLLRSKPDFEVFVQVLLSENGYDVEPSRILRGRCVEHEVDAIAKRDGQTYIVEVKQHADYHTRTGLDVARIARAVLEDLVEGYQAGLSRLKVDRAMIVCNTKFSEHALQYTRCRDILHIGWSSPPGQDLQTMIRGRSVYPITYIRGLKSSTRDSLVSVGIVTLRQLADKRPEDLAREAGIDKTDSKRLTEMAEDILSSVK
ncbi:MAG: restriction endonuclease [Candidatus Bathyarchaeia archaeon]